ncbi:MAG: BamA/TamA family outer membrane protein [bacterium]|jgi:hypothetical protein
MLKRLVAIFLVLTMFQAVSAQDTLSKYSVVNDSILSFKNYFWQNIEYDSNYLEIANRNKLSFTDLKNKKIVKEDFEKQFEIILKYLENNGYPFAEIFFSNITISNNNVNAKLNLVLNDLILVDSVRVISNNVINPYFITSYTEVKPGDIYRENYISEINNKINSLGFLRTKYQTQVYFVNKKAEVVIYPEKINANRFDGLIGIQPNSLNNKTSLVGQAQLYLVNTLKRAERFNFDFRAQPNLTRDLKINFTYPYIFNLPFGIDFDFNFRRQDSSFSIYSPEIGISYLFKAQSSIKFIYKIENSNLLSTQRFRNATELPDVLDVNKFYYGLNFNFEKLDYIINPKTGQRVMFQVMFGQRTIERNAVFADSLFNNIDLKSNQIQLSLSVQKFITVYKRNVLMIGLKSSLLETEDILFNELYRIGGINDIRGFDEQSLFSSAFIIGTLEYRYHLDKNSFLRMFYDWSYLENKLTNIGVNASGVGAGMQVQTNAGMLQLSYALGKIDNNLFSFQNGKIHFGIINYF